MKLFKGMLNKIRLGYHSSPICLNNLPTDCDRSLCPSGADDIRLNRTCQINENDPFDIVPYANELAEKNIGDILKVLEYNEQNNIRFMRISSDICPHISNWRMIKDNLNFRALAYNLEQFKSELKKVGDFCKKYKHRITFHPKPYAVLNTPKPFTLITVMRELYWHARFFDLCGLDRDATITIHGGGVYEDKINAMKTFVENFNKLPPEIKGRLILENDETSYSISDVLEMSKSIEPYTYKPVNDYSKKVEVIECIPVCFDIFHYKCWNLYYKKKKKYYPQPLISEILPDILKTWGRIRPKFHYSEQDPHNRMGTHSEYIKKIPEIILHLDIDLMLESVCRDISLFKLNN